MSKKEREARTYAKKIKKLSKKSTLQNDKCADCGTPRPTWVSLTTGVFLCMRCSSIHRDSYDSQIRSIDLDSWNYELYKSFKSKGGNKKINKNYESLSMRFKQSLKPNLRSDQFELRQFINLKYLEKKWYSVNPQKSKKKKHKKHTQDDDDDDESDEESEDEMIEKIKLPSPPNELLSTNNNITVQNDCNLMDFVQMEKANQWQNVTLLDEFGMNDDEKLSNGIKSKHKILEKYKMKQNEVNKNKNNMNKNKNNNMNNNMSPTEMQRELQRMQMQLKQMQIKLNSQAQNNIDDDDNWANFDDIDNGQNENNNNADDNWANFDENNNVTFQ